MQKRLNLICAWVTALVVAVFLGVSSSAVFAAPGVNRELAFQGRVVNLNGTNVTQGTYNFTFSIYNALTGGTPVWTETKQLTVTQSVFGTNLGSDTPFPDSLNFNQDNLYLGINFNSDGEMTPRIHVAAVAQALDAQSVNGLTVTATTGSLTIPNAAVISFGGNFSTVGANPLSLITSGATSLTLPTSGTLSTLAGSETLSNKTLDVTTITGNLTPSGTVSLGSNLSRFANLYVATSDATNLTVSGTSQLGTVSGGVWQGTSIGAAHGGTGIDTSGSTGIPTLVGGSWSVLANGINNQCLVTLSGVPTWSSCTSGGGVTGSGVTGELSYWDSSSTVAATTGLTWDGAQLGIGTSSSVAPLTIRKASSGIVLAVRNTLDSANVLTITSAGDITAHKLDISSDLSVGGTASVGNTFTVSGGGASITGDITVAGGYTQTGTAANTFTGDTTLNGSGTGLSVANDASVGGALSVSSTINGATISGGTLSGGNISGGTVSGGTLSNTGVNGLSVASGIITSGDWQGTAIGVLYGGTGATDAAGARSNLSAAKLGANSDITSLSGLTTALTTSQGGTGAATFASHGVIYGNGASALQVTAAGTSGQLLVANSSGVPTFVSLSGDGSLDNTGKLSLATVNADTGSFGSATQVPIISVDGTGRITSASTTTITGVTPGGSAGGDLSGSFPNPTVAQINGVALGSTTATAGNLLVGSGAAWVTQALSGDATLSSVGALTIGNGKVGNSKLANSSLTVTAGTGLSGGGSVALGSSITLNNTGVTSITGTSNQVNVDVSTGDVTLSLPQSIATSSTPTFAGLSLTGNLALGGHDITGVGTITAGTLTDGTLSVSSGAISGGTTAVFGTSVTSPTVKGGTTSGGDLTLQSTSNSTKGNVYFNGTTAYVDASSNLFGASLNVGSGTVTSGLVNGQTISSTASFTGTVTAATGLTVTAGGATISAGGLTVTAGGAAITGNETLTGNLLPSGSRDVGASANRFANGYFTNADINSLTVNTSSTINGGVTISSATTPQLTVKYDNSNYLTTAVSSAGAVTFDATGASASFIFSKGVTANTFASSGVTITGGTVDNTSIGATTRSSGAFTSLAANNGFTLSAGALSLPSGSVTNSFLANPSLTVTAGTNLSGGGSVALGSSTTLNIVNNPTFSGLVTGQAGLNITGGIENNSGGITHAGAIAGATTITTSGAINGATITGGSLSSSAVNGLSVSGGVVTTGTWQGSVVGVQYGGTGISSYTAGDIPYANGSTSLTKLGITGTTNLCLVSNGSSPYWGSCATGTLSSTLQQAYDAGRTILTSDNRDLSIELAKGSTVDSNFTVSVDTDSTSQVAFVRADGSGTADPSALVKIENQDTDRILPIGLKIQSAAGGISTAIDVSDPNIVTGLALGASDVTGTNFSVAGSTGVVTSGGLTTAGTVNAGTYTLGGFNINTAGTLSNVAYLNQIQTFTAAQTITAGGTALKVNGNGNITGTLTIGSGATVTTGGLTVSGGGITVTGNSSIAGSLTGLTGLTVASGGASITGGINNNSGGVTNIGAVSGGTTAVFGTSATTPTLYGGTTSGGDLTLQSTSDVTKGKVYFNGSSAYVDASSNYFGASLNVGSGTITSGLINGQTIGAAASFGTSVTVPTVNATSALKLNGNDINSGGTLSNVAYLDQANVYTAGNSFTASGTALSVTHNASVGDLTVTTGGANITGDVTLAGNLLPDVTNTRDIGGSSNYFNNGYITTLHTGGVVSSGASTFNAPVTITSATSPQFTVKYDNSNYATTAVSSAGAVTFDAVGASASFTFSKSLTANVFNSSGVALTGGTIDNIAIGGTTRAAGAFTSLAANGGLTISSGGAAITGNSSVTGTLQVSSTLTASNGFTVSAGSLSLPNSSVTNAFLANSTLTVTAGTNLSGGGSVALGSSTTINVVSNPTFAGLVTAQAGLDVTGGIENNSGGITHAGAIAGASTINASGAITGGTLTDGTLSITSGAVTGGTTGVFATSLTSPTLYGGAGAAGNLTLQSTSNLTKGNVYFNGTTAYVDASSNLFGASLNTGSGTITSGLVNGQTISSSANFTGTVTAATGLTVSAGGASITGNTTIAGNLLASGSRDVGASGTRFTNGYFGTVDVNTLTVNTSSTINGGVTISSATTPQLTIKYDNSNYYTSAVASNGAVTFDATGAGAAFTFADGVTANVFNSSGVTISGGSLDGTTVGASVRSTGAFTTLAANSTSTLASGAGSNTTIGNATGTFQVISSGLNVSTAGALSGVTSIGASGNITTSGNIATTGTGTITAANGLTVTAGGLTVTAGGINANNTGITNAGAVSGVTTLALNNSITQTGTNANTLSGATTISANGASSAPGLALTGSYFTSGSGSTTTPQFLIQPAGTTSSAWSTNGTGIGENAASGFTGNLLDLQLNGTSKFIVGNGGNATLAGNTQYFNAVQISNAMGGTASSAIVIQRNATTQQGISFGEQQTAAQSGLLFGASVRSAGATSENVNLEPGISTSSSNRGIANVPYGALSVGMNGNFNTTAKLVVSNSNFKGLFYYNGASYTNVSTAAATTGSSAYTVLASSSDFFYVGSELPHSGVYFVISQAAVGTGFLAQYWNGTTWATLTLATDGTSGLTSTGRMTYAPPTDWAGTTINGFGVYYYIRLSYSSISTSAKATLTVPEENAPLQIALNAKDSTPILTVSSTGNVGVGTGSPTSLLSVGASSQFQVNSSGAIVASTGIATSGAITNSAAGAASTPAELLSGAIYTGGSGTTTFPQWLLQPTGATAATNWNTAGTALGINTGTFTGNLADIKVNGVSKLTLDASGNLTITGGLTTSSTGTVGFWSRSGTNIQPGTAGDAITTSGNISTSSTGTITSAGLLTASNGLTVTTGAVNITGTSGALTLSGLSASSINLGSNNLTITSGNINTTGTGINGTAIGATTASTGSFTTLASTGTTTLASGAGNNLTLGNATGTFALTSTGVNITTAGVVSGVASINAASGNLAIGNGSGTFALTSTGLNVTTAGAVSGVTTLATSGSINGQTISSSANFTGTLTVATSITAPILKTASGSLSLQAATGVVALNTAGVNNSLQISDSSGNTSSITANAGELQLAGTGTNQVVIGDVGSAENLIFQESSTIGTSGSKTLSFGLSGDIFNLNQTGVTYNVGTLNSTGVTIATSSTSTTSLVVNGPASMGANLLDLQVNGSSQFNVTSGGSIGKVAGITASGQITSSNTGANALALTGAPAASATASLLQLGSAIASGSANGTFIGVNAASGYTGNLADLQVNGSSVFKIDASGNVTSGIVNGQTISSAASFTGTATIAGLLTGSNGFTVTTGAVNITGTSGALALSGLSASSINTGGNNLTVTSGNFNTTATGLNGTAVGATTASTGAFTTLSTSSLLSSTAGLTVTGGVVSLNNSSNFAVNVGTGTNNAGVTIGGSSNTVAITSTGLNLTAAGALSGVTTLATSGTINSQTISSAANFTGSLTVATGVTITAGGLTITAGGINANSTGITNAGAIAGATTINASGAITGGTLTDGTASITGGAFTTSANGNVVALTGTPTASGVSSQVQLGSAIASGSAAGTYLGINTASGFTGNLIDFQKNGTSLLKLTSGSELTVSKAAPTSGSNDWAQTNTSGFANANNTAVMSQAIFNGTLYVGTSNSVDGTQIWKTTDGASWSQANSNGFGIGTPAQNDSTLSMYVFNGALYAATENTTSGTQIWKSTDGAVWTQVNTSGFGAAANSGTWGMTVYNGMLYATVTNWSVGGQVWRSANGTTWTQVNSNGFGSGANGSGLSFGIFNGALYVSTVNFAVGDQIWKSTDGTTWTQTGTSGFGSANNTMVNNLTPFNGALYATTYNSSVGTQIWRTTDGAAWSQVNTNGFGAAANSSTNSLVSFNGQLYAATLNSSSGTQLYRSPDGSSWTQVNASGFGSALNTYAPAMPVFKSALYALTSNASTGTQSYKLTTGNFTSTTGGIAVTGGTIGNVSIVDGDVSGVANLTAVTLNSGTVNTQAINIFGTPAAAATQALEQFGDAALNSGSASGTYIGLNTLGAYAGDLINLQVQGTSKFKVASTGATTIASTLNVGAITSGGTLTITSGGIAVTGNSTIAGTLGGITGLTVVSGGASITGNSSVVGTFSAGSAAQFTVDASGNLGTSGAFTQSGAGANTFSGATTFTAASTALTVNNNALISGTLTTPIIQGSTSSAGTLTLSSTSHATKGKINFGVASTYDEANLRLGIRTTSPSQALDVTSGSINFAVVAVPTAPTLAKIVGGGSLSAGTYKYEVTYVNDSGETSPSAASSGLAVSSSDQITVTIPTSSDVSVTARKIYRTQAGGSNYTYVATVANNTGTTYPDGSSDASIVSNAAAPADNTTSGRLFLAGTPVFYANASNVAVGNNALGVNTSGNSNTAVGVWSLKVNTTGSSNTGLGYLSLFSNTTGGGNVALGYSALTNSVTGSLNTSVGDQSQLYNTTGSNNASFGFQSLHNNSVGTDNTALGYLADYRSPGTFSAAAAAGGSLTVGTYLYRVTFVIGSNETVGTPAPVSVTTTGGNQQVNLSSIPTYSGPWIGSISRKIYRTIVNGTADSSFNLVTTLANNSSTTYTDNIADGSLGAAMPVNTGSILLGSNATALFGNQLVVGGASSTAQVTDGYFGQGIYSNTPSAFTLHSTGGSGSNTAGANFVVAPGQGTGTGVGGDFIIQTASAGLTGTTWNALAERLRVSTAGLTSVTGTFSVSSTSTFSGAISVTGGINNNAGGITNTGAIAGATSINASGAITGGSITDGTATLTIGALTGVTTINSQTISSSANFTGSLTVANGFTLTTGALNLTATSGALALSGLSASSINTGGNNLTVTSGNFNTTATGINGTAIGTTTPSTGAFTTLSTTSLLSSTAGLTVSGGVVSLNNNSNFAVNVGTGTNNAGVTIGGASNTVAITSTGLNLTTAGALSGVTTLATSSSINSQTISSSANFTGSLTVASGFTVTTGALNVTATSGALALSGLGASSINTGSNDLTITSNHFNTTATGINNTAIGATTASTGAFTTLGSTGATSLGNGSSTFAVSSTGLNVTTAGALSGITTIATSSTINGQTIGVASSFTGTVTAATSLTVPLIQTASGQLAIQSATGVVSLNTSGVNNVLKVYGTGGTNYTQITNDGTNAQISTNSGELQLSGGNGSNNVTIGDVGSAANLIFQESSTIASSGSKTLTFGLTGDTLNLNQTGVTYNVGTLTSTGVTLNTSSTSTTALVVNGPASMGANLLDLQVNGSSQFNVTSGGSIGKVSGITASGQITNSNTGANALALTGAPAASATSSLLQLGSAIASGSSSGTFIGVNAANGYVGDLVNLQVNGTAVFKIAATGAVSNLAASAASAPAEIFSGAIFTGGSGTTTFPHFLIQPSGATAATNWNTSGTALGINTSTFTGNLADLKVNGTSELKLDASGNLTITGNLTTASTGTDGFWNRSGTILTPGTSGDAINTSGNIAATGSGTVTSAGLLTASNGFTTTTGAVNITATSGALALSGLSASSINAGANALTITASNINTTGTGINGTAIGATTASTGAFTSLSSTIGTSLATTSGNVAIGNATGTFAVTSTGVNITTAGVVSGVTSINAASGNLAVGNASGTFALTSTGLNVTTAGALSGITTIATSSTINSQTISSTANFTGTVTVATSATIPTVQGSTSSAGTLTLSSTSNGTKGKINLGVSSAYDEANIRLGIGTTSPSQTLQVTDGNLNFTQVTAPTAPTLADVVGGGSLSAGAYTYEVTYVNQYGETQASAASSPLTVSLNDRVTVTIPTSGDTTVTSRKIYRSQVGGATYTLVTTVGDNVTTTYPDGASDASISATAGAPAQNTTGGRIMLGGTQIAIADSSSANVALGTSALAGNTTGFRNVANGYQALFANTTGVSNTAVGYRALAANTGGNYNVAVGYQALTNNTTSNSNAAFGYQTLFTNTTGTQNTALGNLALAGNTTGVNNVATGYKALLSNTTGITNTANGVLSLQSVYNSSDNTALGYSADITVPPSTFTATPAAGAGMGTGVYKYAITFTANGGETGPSATPVSVTTTGGNNQVSLAAIPTLSSSYVATRKIYRTTVGGSSYFLVATIADNTTTTYTDTTADGSLGAAISTSNSSNNILLGYGASSLLGNQFVVGSSSASITDAYLGKGIYDAAPATLTIHSTGGLGSNVAGANLVVAPGQGTGTAAGGDFIVQTAGTGSTGATFNNLAERLRVSSAGLTSITGTLSVSSTSTFGGQLTVSSGGIAVTGNSSITGTFSAGSAAQFAIDASGNVTSGTVNSQTISSTANFTGTVTVATSATVPTVQGSTSSAGTLTLSSTSNGTKGKINLGVSSAYDEANLRLGVRTQSPSQALQVSSGSLNFTQVTPPVTIPTGSDTGGSGGLLTGSSTYMYEYTFVNDSGETPPSGSSAGITLTTLGDHIGLTVPVSSDVSVTSRKVYRTQANGAVYNLVGTVAGNVTTSFDDTASDASIVAAAIPPTENKTGGIIMLNGVQIAVADSSFALGGNALFGYNTGHNITTGNSNALFGFSAGVTLTTGNQNVAVGYQTLVQNATGTGETAIGYQALNVNTNSNNTAVGHSALQYSIVGTQNTAVGSGALFTSYSGNNNVAIGNSADYSVPASTFTATATNVGGSLAVGTYKYLMSYVVNGVESAPDRLPVSATTAGSNLTIDITGYSFPTTSYATPTIKLYRTQVNGSSYFFDQSISVGTSTVHDTVLDISLGAALGTSANSNSIILGAGATALYGGQFIAGSAASAITEAYFGGGVYAASPAAVVLHSTGGLGTDIAGASLTLAPGQGTGAAAGGDLIVKTSATGSSGATFNALAERLRVSNTGLTSVTGTFSVSSTTTFSGAISVTGGINNNAGGITNAGALSGVTTLALNNSITQSGSNANTLTGATTFSGGVVNSTAGAASTPAEILTGAIYTGGSGTTTFPQFLIQPTGATAATNWSTNGTALGVNTAAFTGDLINLKVAGTTEFSVSASGNGTLTGNLTVNGSGTHTFAGTIQVSTLTSSGSLAITTASNGNVNITPNGSGNVNLTLNTGKVTLGDGGTTNYSAFSNNGALTYNGAARPYSEITLDATSAVVPGSANCVVNQTDDGTSGTSYKTVDCPISVDDSATWTFKMPQNYVNSSNVQVDVFWMDTGSNSANSARFDVGYTAVPSGSTFAGATRTDVTGSSVASAGQNKLTDSTITLTAPSISADNLVGLRILRKGTVDNLPDTAKIVNVRIKFIVGS